MITLILSREQAERLLTITDGEIAANKNRLVSAVLSTTGYRDQAEPLARQAEYDTNLRAAIRRALNAGEPVTYPEVSA